MVQANELLTHFRAIKATRRQPKGTVFGFGVEGPEPSSVKSLSADLIQKNSHIEVNDFGNFFVYDTRTNTHYGQMHVTEIAEILSRVESLSYKSHLSAKYDEEWQNLYCRFRHSMDLMDNNGKKITEAFLFTRVTIVA